MLCAEAQMLKIASNSGTRCSAPVIVVLGILFADATEGQLISALGVLRMRVCELGACRV